MRLLRTNIGPSGTLEAQQFPGQDRPPYAILSHTWGENEVLYTDLTSSNVSTHPGFHKIRLTLDQASSDGLEWAWIDNACINKDSSAELSEAINAMYSWYQQAERCYVYLSDLDSKHEKAWPSNFHHCRWFSRGWTLQELLAPRQLAFYAKDWSFLGTKESLSYDIESASGIGKDFLEGLTPIASASIARRMSWASSRSTTRVEDLAYCLMGLFDVNMPMLYGEGSRAFLRLQEEIMKGTDDQSLFAWRATCDRHHHGLLADSPAAFQASADVVPLTGLSSERRGHVSHVMTNRGLQIELPSMQLGDSYALLCVLECQMHSIPGYLAIRLEPTFESNRHYARASCDQFKYLEVPPGEWSFVYVRQHKLGPSRTTPAFHHIMVEQVISPWASWWQSQRGISSGVFYDVLGQQERWDPLDLQNRRVIKIVRQPGFLAAYVTIPVNPMAKFILLFGSDASRKIAFDVWEPVSRGDASLLGEAEMGPSARSSLPKGLKKAFEPQAPGLMTRSSRHCDVHVTVKRQIVDNQPVLALHVHCIAKAEPSRAPEDKSTVKSLIKSVSWRNQSKSG